MTIDDEHTLRGHTQFSKWATVISASIFLLMLLDMFSDYKEGVTWRHLLIEEITLLLSLSGIVYFGRFYYQLTQSTIKMLAADLALAQQQAQHWRAENQELIAGLAKQIQKQFDSWHLSRAEAEVGLLLLKGLSLLEIAQLRQASERTVRDQARAIYRKSGLAGRSELSAFFLEDLLLPR